MSIKNMLQTPENFQLYTLLNAIRYIIKDEEYDPNHKFALIEKIEQKYYEELDKLVGTHDAEGSIIEKFDISITNQYEVVKKLQKIINNFIIDNNQLMIHYLNSNWDEKDKENIFIYQTILDTMTKEFEKDERIKKPIALKDMHLGEEQLTILSMKLGIPTEQLEEKNIKEVAGLLHDFVLKDSEKLQQFDEYLNEADKDKLLSKIHELEDLARKKGIPLPGDENEESHPTQQWHLPDEIVNHINSISNIGEPEKVAALELLEEYPSTLLKFNKEFLEKFRHLNFTERNEILEPILEECLEKRKDSLFEDFMQFDEKYVKENNVSELNKISKEDKKKIWDSMIEAYMNMSEEDRSRLTNGDDNIIIQELADNTYKAYYEKKNKDEEEEK